MVDRALYLFASRPVTCAVFLRMMAMMQRWSSHISAAAAALMYYKANRERYCSTS